MAVAYTRFICKAYRHFAIPDRQNSGYTDFLLYEMQILFFTGGGASILHC